MNQFQQKRAKKEAQKKIEHGESLSIQECLLVTDFNSVFLTGDKLKRLYQVISKMDDDHKDLIAKFSKSQDLIDFLKKELEGANAEIDYYFKFQSALIEQNELLDEKDNEIAELKRKLKECS
ncbi:hypothetical protein ACODM8_09605 [Vibrio ostreicida]|uniref:hypothetical protein n=1 Tax=Vibrio ostreicida TaxID=526588 RepID=UPI003B5A3463